jgi:hypothetical protein
MNITTKTNPLVLTLMILFFSLLSACKSKEEIGTPPNQPPGTFNVTSTLSTNGQDVILKWTKSKDPDGDIVTYAVVYKDTLIKNLSDTIYTIKNLPFETEIKGTIVAKDTKGSRTVSAFSVLTGMDYVAIPDVNFEKILIKLKIDNVQDGQVLRANVLNVTSLSMDGASGSAIIKDLTGIEEFVNLKILNCSNLHLSSLDVSKNTALTTLYCSEDGLTSLDVSKNIVLTVLDCRGNQLTNLDVGKNTVLIELICNSNNQLTSLDVSKNTTLKSLRCSSNQLTSLDISKNTALRSLSCSSNQLTSLDVSKNIALTELSCSYNKIQTICVNNLNQVTSNWEKDPIATYKVCP